MKKLFAALMALMMFLLPAMGLADGNFLLEAAENGRAIESVTTFVAGKSMTGTEAVDKIIGEILSALRVTCYWQEIDGTQAGLRVALDGKDVLTADMAGKDGEIFVTSDLLADTTIAMKPGEADVVADRLLDVLVRKGLMTKEQADEIRSQIEAAAQAAAGEVDTPSTSIDYEKMMQDFLDNADAFDALLDWVLELADRVEEADVTGQPENSDPATEALRLSLTAEDIIKGWELVTEPLKANEEYMKLLDQAVAQSGDYESGAALLDDVTATLREKLPRAMKDDAVLMIYTADGEPVAMTFDMALEDGADTMATTVRYTRLTTDGVATHTVRCATEGTEKGEAVSDVTEVTVVAKDDALDLTMISTENGETTTTTLHATWTDSTLDATMTTDDGDVTTLTLAATWTDNTLNATLTIADDDGTVTCALNADWADTDAGQTLHATLTLTDTESTNLTFTLNATWSATDAERSLTGTVGWSITGLDATLDGTGSLDITFNEKKTGEQDAEQLLVFKLTVNDKHLITVINESKTVDPYPSIMIGDVKRPVEMTDDELDAWFDDVYSNIQVWAIKLIQSLPASVLMLFMGVQ